MREVLFKAKRIDDAKWVDGDLMHAPHTTYVGTLGESYFEVDPTSVCQYTGLIDQNGKKIFEGDIVTGWFDHVKTTGTIIYGSDATFFIQRIGLHGIWLNNAGDWVEVICNVHDKEEHNG